MMKPFGQANRLSIFYQGVIIMNLARYITGVSLSVVLCAGAGLAAEPADVEKFVKSRIEIG